MLRTVWLRLCLFLLATLPAQCWWENGHRTTARLAAYYLTPPIRARLAAIMGVPDTPESVADGLAEGSTWPDDIKRDRPETNPWHYIDLTLQDGKNQISARCPDQNCLPARIEMYSAQLINDRQVADQKVDLDALRFLVHFVGDLHQPLHAVSDADLGGNCEPLTKPYETAKNLHALWDGPLVNDLDRDDRRLAESLEKELDAAGEGRRKKMAEGDVSDWTWESHKIAAKVIYKRLAIPKEPVVFPSSCKVAPEAIVNDKIEVRTNYMNAMKPVVRLQLERAGLRLAKLLNAL